MQNKQQKMGSATSTSIEDSRVTRAVTPHSHLQAKAHLEETDLPQTCNRPETHDNYVAPSPLALPKILRVQRRPMKRILFFFLSFFLGGKFVLHVKEVMFLHLA